MKELQEEMDKKKEDDKLKKNKTAEATNDPINSSRQKMITRDEQLGKINVEKERLPKCLRKNKMNADELLFKEAQFTHAQRKANLQRQIVVDNLQFLMLEAITEFAHVDPKEAERQMRNRQVVDLAKRVISSQLSRE